MAVGSDDRVCSNFVKRLDSNHGDSVVVRTESKACIPPGHDRLRIQCWKPKANKSDISKKDNSQDQILKGETLSTVDGKASFEH